MSINSPIVDASDALGSRHSAGTEIVVGLPERPVYAPMSSAQQRLWFMDRLLPGIPLYHVPAVLQFSTEVDCDALRDALSDLIARHEVLRTSFQTVDLEPMQRIHDDVPLDWNVADFRLTPAAAKLAKWTHSAAQTFNRPFDLEKPPLIRAVLYQFTDDHHALMIVMHHIICDAWSHSILSSELKALYEARASGTPAGLEPLLVQYSDFAVWQQRMLESGVWDGQISYWKRKLADAPQSALPGAAQRSAHPSYRGGARSFAVPANVADGLKAISQREGATLFMTFLAAFKALLSRHSGETDIVVGAPIAGRTRPEFEPLIGCFVNAIVLRTDLVGNPDFLRLVRRVKEVCLNAYANQDIPFEKLVEVLQPNRSMRNPLFQVAFALQHVATDAGHHENGGRRSLPEFSAGTAKFDLFLALAERRGTIDAVWEFDRDVFSDDDIDALTASFLTLLRTVAARPAVRLSELPLLSPEDEALLDIWNGTAGEDHAEHFPARFAEAAATYAERLALADSAERLTYAELRSRAEAVAHALRAIPIGSGDIVGIYCRRSVGFVIGMIGTLMAGGAYVPIDPDYPDPRQKAMLDEIPDAVIVAEGSLAGRLAEFGRRVVTVEQPSPIAKTDGNASLPTVGATSLAYGIFTSGTTGRPKLAAVRHDGLTNLLSWYVRQFELAESDRVLIVTSPSFDLTQKNLLAPLLIGATVHLSPPGEFATHRICRKIDRDQITIINCTPSLFYSLADTSVHDESLLSLRLVVLGGEPIVARRLLRLIQADRFRAKIVNTYGPTECSDVVAFHQIDDIESYVDSRVPIGRPIDNVRLYVLDDHLGRVPLGSPGELCVGGAAVGAGYVNDRDLTKQRFVPDPYVRDAKRYMYRTGDRARFLKDGAIEFLGRSDFQIKLHGFRIELQEIEAVIRQHPAVEDVVVAPVSTTRAGDRLAAFVVPNEARAAPIISLLRIENDERLLRHSIGELPNGMTIVQQNRSETDFLYRELFEERLYFRHGIEMPANAIVFDVGANIGLFALSIARERSDVQIYAFEPIPPIYEALELNLNVHARGARAFNVGLSDASGTADFSYYPHASILSGRHAGREEDRDTVRRFLTSQADGGAAPHLSAEQMSQLLDERLRTEQFTCTLKTLSDVIREHAVPRIDLLKIDVEKSELAALRGIEPVHWPLIQQIVVEVHDIQGQVDVVSRLLTDKGFAVAIDQDQALATSGMFSIYAKRADQAFLPTVTPSVSAVAGKKWESLETLKRDVRSFAAERLPDYMVPGVAFLIKELPKTPSGKLDRNELQLMATAQLDNRVAAFVGPRDPAEERVANVWGAILGAPQIGIHDNFFDDLGGDSLLATQVIARLCQELETDLPLRLMFEYPTIALFSAALAQQENSPTDTTSPPDQHGKTTGEPRFA